MSSASGPATPREDVVVLCERFPAPSETFVTGEVDALARAGHAVSVIARERGPGAPPAGVRAVFAYETPRRVRAACLAWLIATRPRRCLADLRGRRRWRREEEPLALRLLAPQAWALRGRPSVHLHAHFAKDAALDALRLGRLLDRPWSVTAHAYDIYLQPANLEEKLRRASFATSGCAYTVYELRRRAGPAAAGRVHEIVMGVRPEVWRRGSPLRGGRHVVAVGRLVPKKGFVHLLRATAMLHADGAVDRVTIVGEGPQRSVLEAEIARLRLGAVVRLVGAREPAGVRGVLEDADLLCMPCVVAPDGDRDSMPVVVKEAMAMELAIVASDEVGLPEIVRSPWGRLAAPGDPRSLATAIADVLGAPPAERAAMGRAAREHVRRHADLDVETAKLAGLIAAAR